MNQAKLYSAWGIVQFYQIYTYPISIHPRANGAKRRSGRKPGARVTNFVLAELKVVARDR